MIGPDFNWGDLPVDEANALLAENAQNAPSTGTEAEEDPWRQEWSAPGPKADAFYWSDADVCLIRGPVGSGKTTMNLRKPFRRARAMPISTMDGRRHYKVVVARATYRQLWQTTIPSWFEIVPRKLGEWAGGRGDPVTHRIQFEDEHGPVEFIAEFLAFGETDAEIQANVRGVQTTDFALEEADTTRPILFATAMGRIDRYPSKAHFKAGPLGGAYPADALPGGQINMSYNAPEEGNWILALEGDTELVSDEDRAIVEAVQQSGIRIAFFRQPGAYEQGAENLQNLGAKYYDRQVMAMRAVGRQHEVERLVHNKIAYIPDGEPVFQKSFNRRMHVAEGPLEPWQGGLRLGFDQGFFGAMLVMQFKPPFCWQVLAEFTLPNRTMAARFGQEARRFLNDDARLQGLPIVSAHGDMAGEQGSAIAGDENATWNELVGQAMGIHIEPQMFGNNRVQPRLNAWFAALDNPYMGEPCMLIDPGCRLLIRGMEAKYVWAKEIERDVNATAKPKKAGCRAADVIDAGGYELLSEINPDGTTPLDPGAPPPGPGLLGHNGGPPMAPAREDVWIPAHGLGG